MQKPKLKSFLTVFPISETVWGLRGGSDELWRLKLRNERAIRTFGVVLPWLNGAHVLSEILDEAERQGIDREAVVDLLGRLESSGLLEDVASSELSTSDEQRFRRQITFFSRFTADGGARYQALLGRTRVAVVGDGPLAQSVCRQLDDAGFGTIVVLDPARDAPVHDAAGSTAPMPVSSTPSGNGDDASAQGQAHRTIVPLDRQSIWPPGDPDHLPRVVIVPQEAHDPKLLESMDAFSKRFNVAWMLLRAVDFKEAWVGPLFVPNDTADYLSLEARLRANVPYFEEYQAFTEHLRAIDGPAPPSGGLHAHFDLLGAIAVSEVVKFVTGITVPFLAGRILTVNLASWETEAHDVLKIPRVGLDVAQEPSPFPWKEIPYGELPGSRDGILARRA